MDVWNALAGIGAVVAAIVAIWAVIVAHRANAQAEASNLIAEKALKLQKRLAPPAWSQVQTSGSHSKLFSNGSGRHIKVERIEVIPASSAADFGFPRMPHRVEYGDSLRFSYHPTTASLVPDRVVIYWAFLDKPDERKRTERGL